MAGIDNNPSLAPQVQAQVPRAAEDAAAEGGEAVATFSNYKAPLWAIRAVATAAAAVDSSNSQLVGGAALSAKCENAVIDLDNDDDDNDDDNDDDDESDDEILVIESRSPPKVSKKEEEDIKPAISSTRVEKTAPVTSPAVPISAGEDKDETNNIPSHSSPACESGLLASVSAPEPNDECLRVVKQLAQEGKLSPLQVEGVGLAIQRHCRLLKKNDAGTGTSEIEGDDPVKLVKMVRAGFFLGDGAGIGKGRQIAAVLRDSFSRSVRETKAANNNSFASPSPSTSKTTGIGSKMISSRRRRHLWISVSRELIEDARRDLKDVGCHAPVIDGVEILGGSAASKKPTTADSGVLFITYAFLVSGKGKRMNDIIKWLTHGNGTNRGGEAIFDGCIIFDEAHKAKNLCADPPTTTGLLVLELQERLANARVMYCSATGVSNLEQMGYATRLGLWGAGTNFPTFDSFRGSLEKRGVGAMEMLALEMKQAGCFVARTLSWDGAEFESVKVQLTPEQISIYDKSMKWWDLVKSEIKAALALPGMNGTPKMLWSQYWSAIQRFAKELAICIKIPLIANSTLKQLESGHSVVIGLQSTGEASTQATLHEMQAQRIAKNLSVQNLEDISLPAILSTASAIMASFVRNHFPVAPQPPEPIKVPRIPPGGFSTDYERQYHHQMTMLAAQVENAPPPEVRPELIWKQQELLNAINTIPLPPSPLDDLIDRLGGAEKVAEMTGRSGRILRSNSNSFKFVKRCGVAKENKFGLSMPTSQEDNDRLNVIEKKKFMDGRKKVAIISDAASTGISLHARAGTGASDRRRIHYTIELPWAADKAIQQLGRTHRSGQLSAPIYKMVVTELGGERRFAAAIAKRMAGLGALTKGDRRAATGSDFSEFDVDSRFGKRSLKRLYDCMTAQPPYTPSKTSNLLLDNYILNMKDANISDLNLSDGRIYALEEAQKSLEMIGIEATSDARKNGDVKVFLNRIAALTVAKQNLIFGLFTSTMEDVIVEAKATGEFEGSVEQIRATSIELSSDPETITVDGSSGALTKLATFNVDRGCSFNDVCQLCLNMIPPNYSAEKDIEINNTVAESGFYVSKREVMGRHLIVFAKRKIHVTEEDEEDSGNRIDYDPLGLMVLTRPNTGTNPCEMNSEDLCRKYRLIVSVNDAKNLLLDNQDSNYLNTVFTELLSKKYQAVSKMWKTAYAQSNAFSTVSGLAPRRSKIGMVTGSVLHCLPVLEKAVASMSSQRDRSLKVIRIELTNNNKRLVGVRFPINEDAVQKLRTYTAALDDAKGKLSNSNANDNFLDKAPDPIQAKSVLWLTTPPATMKSFFKSANSGTKRNIPSSNVNVTPKITPKKKIQRTGFSTAKKAPCKKASAITSFFKKV